MRVTHSTGGVLYKVCCSVGQCDGMSAKICILLVKIVTSKQDSYLTFSVIGKM